MYSDILKTVRSVADRDFLLSEIDELKKSIYDTKNGGIDNALHSSVRQSVAVILKSGIEKSGNASDYLEGLDKELKALPEIKLTIAIEPTGAMVNAIYSWLDGNLKQNLILDVEVDPTVVAGAMISYQGKYYDGSLAKLL